MVEIRSLHLGDISRLPFERIFSSAKETIQPLGEEEPEVASPTPVFESRFHLSREEQRRLTEDTLKFNKAKAAHDPTNRGEYDLLMRMYEGLRERYADPSSREATIPDEAYRQSITPVLYTSPFRQIETVSPALSQALGD